MRGSGVTVFCLYHPAGIDAAALQALGEACLRLSSQVALRDGEAVFLEAGGSRYYFGEAGLRARFAALGRRFPGLVPPRMGVGRDAGEALARARFAAADGPTDALPLEALECYASPFRVEEAVAAALAPLIQGLQALGLKDLGGLRRFPAAGLGERFGADAAALRERLEGRFPMGWPRFEPAPQLEEIQDLRALDTQSAGPSDEALRFHLKSLCDRVAARLRGRGLRAAGLELRLGFERIRGRVDQADRVIALRLSLPLASPRELGRLLQERLEREAQARPLPRLLAALGLKVTATAPGFHPQRDAFDRREEAAEALHGLLSRLTQRLGEDHVFYAALLQRYLPEQAWRRDLTSPPARDSAGNILSTEPYAPLPSPPWRGEGGSGERRVDHFDEVSSWGRGEVPRPSRVFKRPLQLTRSGDWLLYWGGAARGKRWKALAWEGPERLGRPWWQAAEADWDQDSPARDYWRVRSAEGPDLWVFSRQGAELESGVYWLQGWWG